MKNATFIGGPADLERRCVDDKARVWCVAEMEQPPQLSPRYGEIMPEMAPAKIHEYHLLEVTHNVWVALHNSLVRR